MVRAFVWLTSWRSAVGTRLSEARKGDHPLQRHVMRLRHHCARTSRKCFSIREPGYHWVQSAPCLMRRVATASPRPPGSQVLTIYPRSPRSRIPGTVRALRRRRDSGIRPCRTRREQHQRPACLRFRPPGTRASGARHDRRDRSDLGRPWTPTLSRTLGSQGVGADSNCILRRRFHETAPADHDHPGGTS